MNKYFEKSEKGERFRSFIHGMAMLIVVTSVVCISMVSAYKQDDESRYELLHSNFERDLNKAYDSYEELARFMEKQESKKGNYDKASEYKSIQENRENWKVVFR